MVSHEAQLTRDGVRLIEVELSVGDVPDLLEYEYPDGTRAWYRADAPELVHELDGRGARPREGGNPGWVRVLRFKDVLVKVVAGGLLKAAEFLDRKIIENPGFFRVESGLDLASSAGVPSAKGPLIVMVHGTVNHVPGSFHGFEARLDLLRKEGKFDVWGFQHPTLSQSPLQNALELAVALSGRKDRGEPNQSVTRRSGGGRPLSGE